MKEGINTSFLDSKFNTIAVGDYLIPNDLELAAKGAYYKVSRFQDARFIQPHVHGVKSVKLKDICTFVHIASEAEKAAILEKRNTRSSPNRKKKSGSVPPEREQLPEATVANATPETERPNVPSLEEILPGLEHPDRCTVFDAPDQMLVDELRGRGFEVTCKKVTTIIL